MNRASIDRMHITTEGEVSIRFLVQTLNDAGHLVSTALHRVTVQPKTADSQTAAVNTHLKAMGCAMAADTAPIATLVGKISTMEAADK